LECFDLEIVYENAIVTVQPLIPEVEDDAGLTDLSELHDPGRGIMVLARNKEQQSRLHFVAATEVTRFLGTKEAPLGLVSFDGANSLPEQIASSCA
jgi:hypothetical protein